jgi:hypothetical protein
LGEVRSIVNIDLVFIVKLAVLVCRKKDSGRFCNKLKSRDIKDVRGMTWVGRKRTCRRKF